MKFLKLTTRLSGDDLQILVNPAQITSVRKNGRTDGLHTAIVFDRENVILVKEDISDIEDMINSL